MMIVVIIIIMLTFMVDRAVFTALKSGIAVSVFISSTMMLKV